MAIDPNIKKKAEEIRRAQYGGEVQESLASGLESMSEHIVDNTGRQDYVEQQLQAVHDSTRGKDVISATEILASQVGADGTKYNNMKERLDAEQNKVNAQLAQIGLKSFVSVTDYGADPTGKADSTTAIQKAINEAKTVYFPVGTYLISDSLREATNGGARRFVGENQFGCKILAHTNMVNKPMIWLGNSTGHANYFGSIEKIKLDGGDKNQNNIGIRWHEAGTSITKDVTVENCGIAIEGLGSIHNRIEGNIYIAYCKKGIIFKRIDPGIPDSINDVTTTAHPISLSTNMSKIINVWFNSIEQEVIWVEGGLCKIEGCTLQGSPNGNGDFDAITLINANEAYDYGGGSIVENCWFEQLQCRYAIAVRNTRAARIKGNFISGNDGYPDRMEGGILLNNADNTIVKENSIRGLFRKNPTQGRIHNAAVYVDALTRLYTCTVDENYLTKNTTNYYYEGIEKETFEKLKKPHWLSASLKNASATVIESSDDFVLTVARLLPGIWTIQYTYNRPNESIYPIQVMPVSNSGEVFSTSVYEQNVNYDRISFKNASGELIDPDGFILFMYSNTNSI